MQHSLTSRWRTAAMWLGAAALLAAAWPATAAPADEGRYKMMAQFSQEQGSPKGPLLLASDGKLYGILNGDSLFRMLPGGRFTELRRFDQPGDPIGTYGLMEGRDGHLYGASWAGGQFDAGALYRINHRGSELQMLHSFETSGCRRPVARLIQASDGDFYGTTSEGGRFDRGCAFRMTRDGQVSVLHEFGDPDRVDGAGPREALVQASDGLLYGVTVDGGRHGAGTVFRVNRQGFFQVLHSFHQGPDSPDGSYPNSALVEGPDGQLYGTTYGWGGSIYKIDLGRTLTRVYEFVLNGNSPRGDLCMGADGALTGNAFIGGYGQGVVYQLRPDGSYHVLHTFAVDGREGRGTDGLAAVGENDFFGITDTGGDLQWGTIFRVRVAPTLPH